MVYLARNTALLDVCLSKRFQQRVVRHHTDRTRALRKLSDLGGYRSRNSSKAGSEDHTTAQWTIGRYHASTVPPKNRISAVSGPEVRAGRKAYFNVTSSRDAGRGKRNRIHGGPSQTQTRIRKQTSLSRFRYPSDQSEAAGYWLHEPWLLLTTGLRAAIPLFHGGAANVLAVNVDPRVTHWPASCYCLRRPNVDKEFRWLVTRRRKYLSHQFGLSLTRSSSFLQKHTTITFSIQHTLRLTSSFLTTSATLEHHPVAGRLNSHSIISRST